MNLQFLTFRNYLNFNSLDLHTYIQKSNQKYFHLFISLQLRLPRNIKFLSVKSKCSFRAFSLLKNIEYYLFSLTLSRPVSFFPSRFLLPF